MPPHKPTKKTCEDCGKEFKPVNVLQKKCVECLRKSNLAVRDAVEAMRREAGENKQALQELGVESDDESGRQAAQEPAEETASEPAPEPSKKQRKPRTVKTNYPPKFCDKCGLEFVPRTKLMRYCENCRGSLAPERFKGDKSGIINCVVCGKEFEAKNAQNAKYCSPECGKATRTKAGRDKKDVVSDNQKMVWVRCMNPECPNGNKFQTTWEKYRKGARYCDTNCRDHASRLKGKKYQQELEEKRRGNVPVQVVEIDYAPHPAQKEFHNSPARFKVLVCGIRFGKDRACIQEFIWRFAEMLSEKRPNSLVPRVHGWLVAPTFPLSRQMWREIKDYFPAQWVLKKNEAEMRIETIGDGLIEVKSALDPDGLVAVGIDIAILSEFAKVTRKEEVWTNIRARVSSPGRGPYGTGGIVLINSTPKGMDLFYDMYQWGQSNDPKYKNWKSFQYPSSANPYMNLEEIIDAERTIPRRLFNQEYLAEFLRDGGEVFLNIDEVSIAPFRDPEPGMTYKAAWDPAEKLDFSCFGVRNQRGEQVFIRRWTGIPYSAQMDEAAYYCKLFNHAPLEIDVTAAGSTALVEGMIQRGVNAVGVTFSNLTKAQWVSHLSILFESKIVTLLRRDLNDDTEAQNKELKAYTYHYTSGDKISYHHPSSGHDDCVDMLLMLYKDFHTAMETLPYIGTILGARRQTA